MLQPKFIFPVLIFDGWIYEKCISIFFFRKPEEKKSLWELVRSWENNIKTDLKKMVCGIE